MSIQVTLIVDDTEFNLLQHYFGFFQNSDYTGRPTSAPQADTFDCVIEASKKDEVFFEWAIHPQLIKKKVEIMFSSRFGTGKSTKITLLDVHCTYCKYHFSSTGSNPFTVTFSLSPATILLNGQVMLSRHWKVTEPTLLNQPFTVKEEKNEPRIIRQYVTDTEDVELDNYKRGQDVYCVLESEYLIGEIVDIDLSNFEVSLLYRGKKLPDNIIKNFSINSDEEKIPLQVIPETYEDEQ
ncbi:MAG: type VI secretion system tube protein TssD [Bacteroidota bacterium]